MGPTEGVEGAGLPIGEGEDPPTDGGTGLDCTAGILVTVGNIKDVLLTVCSVLSDICGSSESLVCVIGTSWEDPVNGGEEYGVCSV